MLFTVADILSCCRLFCGCRGRFFHCCRQMFALADDFVLLQLHSFQQLAALGCCTCLKIVSCAGAGKLCWLNGQLGVARQTSPQSSQHSGWLSETHYLLFHNLDNIFIIQDMIFAYFLWLMFDRGTPDQCTANIQIHCTHKYTVHAFD